MAMYWTCIWKKASGPEGVVSFFTNQLLGKHLKDSTGANMSYAPRWVYVFDGDGTPETVDPSELRKAVEALDKYTGYYQEVCCVLTATP